MLSDRAFSIDENHNGIEVSKIYKDGYRFPTGMLATGRMYNGVEATLNKPHGKKVVMEYIIKLLMKGKKQYRTFIDQSLQRFSWMDVNDALEILLLDGIIQITFKNQKPRKMVDWSPKMIQLDPRVMESSPEKIPDYSLELAKLRDMVIELTINIKITTKDRLLKWIDEKEIKDEKGMRIANFTSSIKYKAIVLAATYYLILKENGEKLPLRYLSNQLWNQPRLLNTYKKEIALSLGITLGEFNTVLLSDINSTLHAPLVLISPVTEMRNLLDKFSIPEIQHDTILLYIDEMDNYFQKIIELVGDSFNSNFSQSYSIFKKELIEGHLLNNRQAIINDLKQSVYDLNKQMLKKDHIRQQFELIVLEEIGSGSFARVYKVFDPESKKIVACKVLFPRSYFKQVYGNDGDEYILRFKREVRLLTNELQHVNIINVIKIHPEGSPFWFTMPLASLSLEKWIKKNPNASIDQRMRIFAEILSGVKYLHEQNKYHRDLAPNNILLYEVNNDIEVKIADFGLAKDPKSISFFTGLSKKGYGQEEFTDPRQLDNLANSTNLSDIYSLGALLYYIVSGKLPKKRFYVKVFCQNVVIKAMDTRERRYQTIYDFENDLNGYFNMSKKL